jgi:predicted nicotinamide N-methyase
MDTDLASRSSLFVCSTHGMTQSGLFRFSISRGHHSTSHQTLNRMNEPRPKITDLFRSATANGLTNSKHRRLFQSLQWRQAFEHSEFYEYTFEDGQPFRVRQIPNGELKGLGTGTFVWPAAHVLAKYLERRFGVDGLQNRLVCDIGSGTGLTGFVAAKLGATVLCTDQKCVLPLLQENATAFLQQQPEVCRDSVLVADYDWNAKQSLSTREFDYVLVSDCVLPKLYPIDILVEVS